MYGHTSNIAILAIFSRFYRLIIRIRLILPQSKDSGPKSLVSRVGSAVKPIFLAIFYTRFILALIFLGIPNTANASLFSFVADLLSSNNTPKSAQNETNSQNMALLQATINPNFKESTGGGDITIVDGTAILAEANSSGEIGNLDQPTADQISIYVVRPGDSLSQIAHIFGVSVNTIIWSNDIKNSIIVPGQTLVILPISGIRHTIKSGDTLKGLATLYKTDLEEILQFNGLSADSKLAIGDVVVVPDGVLPASNTATSGSSAQSSTARVVSGYPTYEGYYMRPIIGGIKTQGLHGFNGVDLASSIRTPIMASASGDVIVSRGSGWNGGYGQYIVIKHSNGTQTLYGHLSQNIVFSGDHVVQGQVIGYMGSTGKSTGSHLHFEIRGAKNPF